MHVCGFEILWSSVLLTAARMLWQDARDWWQLGRGE